MTAGTQSQTGSVRAPNAIVLLADGTGNSSGALFKTNVWRLYQALDLNPASGSRQLAYYHDGVGTSAFRPLALLGGVFGWGLKRNILELYTFLCRNYKPGDRIYAFGFSRGAFTIRLLVGLIVTQGILQGDEEVLAYATKDAYRAYRHNFNVTGGLVKPLRWLRDSAIGIWRRIKRQVPYHALPKEQPKAIDFVGVWETVAAYGLPLSELTRGIDDWVWPLSMPNYRLSPKVTVARHALALDDERDTFHPLLWDEINEVKLVEEGTVKANRLQQVWFAGMHSDVGGGYSDDSLAYVSLGWMISEASQCGLRFDPSALQLMARARNEHGPLHDSRRGLAGYYRYQPRKLSARMQPRDPTTLIMQDPDLAYGLLQSVNVHDSVLHRIRDGTDSYAPIVLPQMYTVVAAGTSIETAQQAANRATQQDRIWDTVWRKRVTYFATVGVSLVLAAFPLIQAGRPPGACEGPQCLISPLITSLGMVLPGVVNPWLNAFAATPGRFLITALVLLFLLQRSRRLKEQIRDEMRDLWVAPAAGRPPAKPDGWIYRLRTSWAYQRGIQLLKWRVVPAGFGLSVLVAGALAALAVIVVFYDRLEMVAADEGKSLCTVTVSRPVPEGTSIPAEGVFETKNACWPTGLWVEAGAKYRIKVRVTEEWQDTVAIPTSPLGFGPERMPRLAGYWSVPVRRSITHRWFQPLVKVQSPDGRGRIYALEMRRADIDSIVYEAEFKPTGSGSLFFFVNDAMVFLGGDPQRYYKNNLGKAEITVQRLP
jgi:uncharacterized protein (DUF2235 family)